MFKYDFDVDLSTETSTGKIISKLKPGMTILEFGCGSGRMTKYMQGELGCHVYIAEYVEEAYNEAIKFAEDGICEDVQQFGWYEKFKDIRFDCILFVDVLEHLVQNEAVLAKSKKLLKDDGHIYISIPNVTHNDILIKAANEQFNYTDTGLLDNTHVHFWGLKNIPEWIGNCGLNLDLVEATYAPTGYTEQFESYKTDVPSYVLNYLRGRTCGEIYEFILTLSASGSTETTYELRTPYIESFIYFDCGSDFSADNTQSFRSEMVSEGIYRFHCEINLPEGTKRIKLDPVEDQKCILANFSVAQDNNKLKVLYADPIELDNGVLLNSDDPKIYVEDIVSASPLIISGDIILEGNALCDAVNNKILSTIDANSALQKEIHDRDVSIGELQQTIKNEIEQHIAQNKKAQEQFETSIKELKESHESFIVRLRGDYDKMLATKQEEMNHVHLLLGSYRTLADAKDMALVARENEIKNIEQQIDGLNSQINDLNAQLADLTARYDKTLDRQVKRFLRRAKNYTKKKLRAIRGERK